MRFAIPLTEGKLSLHFGHCREFALVDVTGRVVTEEQTVTPPPHQPGLLPRWLAEQGVDVVIAGGMGGRAVGLFEQMGIEVVTGAPRAEAAELVKRYLSEELQTGPNACDH